MSSLLIAVGALAAVNPPVFATDYLARGDSAGGRAATKVQGLPSWAPESYAGYLRTSDNPTSAIFFWYFAPLNKNPDAPTLMWLQGGPGASSLFGLFKEIGPFDVADDGATLVQRAVAWTNEFGVVFFDNPVGTGYSFTTDDSGYARYTVTDVGRTLLNATAQFFDLFPALQGNPFYITGESYAGKYVPAAALAIQRAGLATIPLAGISVGDGAIKPRIQTTGIGDVALQMGFLDQRGRDAFQPFDAAIAAALDKSPPDYQAAFSAFDQVLNGDFWPYGTLWYNLTGMTNYFNTMAPGNGGPAPTYPTWLVTEAARNMLHVGTYGYASYNASVERALIDDWMRAVDDVYETLLNSGLKVLIYSGTNDIILGPARTDPVIDAFNWAGMKGYAQTSRAVWSVQGDVAGWVRQFSNFLRVTVRGCGHMVPSDQPERAYDLMHRFVFDLPFPPSSSK